MNYRSSKIFKTTERELIHSACRTGKGFTEEEIFDHEDFNKPGAKRTAALFEQKDEVTCIGVTRSLAWHRLGGPAAGSWARWDSELSQIKKRRVSHTKDTSSAVSLVGWSLDVRIPRGACEKWGCRGPLQTERMAIQSLKCLLKGIKRLAET